MSQQVPRIRKLLLSATVGSALALVAACGGAVDEVTAQQHEDALARQDSQGRLVKQGQQIFRFDTFGDERQWTDVLRLHEVISAAVDPLTALSVGLKVDAEALPAAVVDGIRNGSVDLRSPATTIALLKLDAVVGIKGTIETVNGVDRLARVGITCALCHSTVDNSFASGIGKRLDGWANRDLNPGAIIALSPALDAATKAVYNSWGKGKFDPRYRTSPLKGVWQHAPYFHDGSAATLEDVVQAYNTKRSLGLGAQDVADLAQYLKSL